jgi:hypothetical protein
VGAMLQQLGLPPSTTATAEPPRRGTASGGTLPAGHAQGAPFVTKGGETATQGIVVHPATGARTPAGYSAGGGPPRRGFHAFVTKGWGTAAGVPFATKGVGSAEGAPYWWGDPRR